MKKNCGIIEDISRRMKAFTGLCGFHAVWKRLDGLAEKGLRRDQALHCNDFCLAVKNSRAMEGRCRGDDNIAAVNAVLERREAYLKTCHAGISELVIPLFVETRLEGLLFIGPFRLEGGKCTYSRILGQFNSLPVLGLEQQNELLMLADLIAGEILKHYQCIIRNRTGGGIDRRIEEAVKWMQQHISESFTAAEVAENCHLSTSRFIHLFAQEMGEAFSERRLRLRVERAKSLLENTGIGMGAVAAESGFSSQNHFSSVFKRSSGTTPLQYRRKYRAESEA